MNRARFNSNFEGLILVLGRMGKFARRRLSSVFKVSNAIVNDEKIDDHDRKLLEKSTRRRKK